MYLFGLLEKKEMSSRISFRKPMLWSRCTESLLWTAVFATVSTSAIRIPPIIAIFPPKACIALMVFITQSFSQIMLDTVFFYSCVSFIQKYVFPADELKIVLDCFWQAALFKRCVPTPYIYSWIILGDTILQKEKVHISLEVHKQIEKCFIAFYYLWKRAAFPCIISANALKG